VSTSSNTYYRSDVTLVGEEAVEMVEGGIVIFFGEPCPTELAEISIVHKNVSSDPQRDPRPGDRLRVGDAEVVFTRVGDRAGHNLKTLGHFVIYCNPEADQNLLPGAIHVTGQLSMPVAGSRIELIGE
jgi:PTS system glucitol/sorbitol-specific IIA component